MKNDIEDHIKVLEQLDDSALLHNILDIGLYRVYPSNEAWADAVDDVLEETRYVINKRVPLPTIPVTVDIMGERTTMQFSGEHAKELGDAFLKLADEYPQIIQRVTT